MPIYEYQCEACDHQLEKLQKISDDPLKICPECNTPELTKLVSAAAFRLKGDGWYETDFKTGTKKNVTDSDSSSSSSSDAANSDSSGAANSDSSGAANSDSSSSSPSSSSSGGSSGDSSKSAAAG